MQKRGARGVESSASEEAAKAALRPFPMQDGPPIPWYVAEAIYKHLHPHGHQSLERVAQRGGYGWGEVAYMWTHGRGHLDACRAEIVAPAALPHGASPAERKDLGNDEG